MNTVVLDDVELSATDETLKKVRRFVDREIPELKVGDVVFFHHQGHGDADRYRLIVPREVVGDWGDRRLVAINASGAWCQSPPFTKLQKSGAYELLYNVFEGERTD